MDKQEFIEKLTRHVSKLHELHERIKDLHESLHELQPIAIVDNSILYIFDVNPHSKNYEFAAEHQSPWPLPQTIAAALPLDCYNFHQDKVAAIVGADYFENPEGYAIVFHEFVHCFVWNKYEWSMKKELTIEKQQKEAGNISWELNYPFPYDDDLFVSMTAGLHGLSTDAKLESYINYHKRLKDYLKETDFEYMVWQEWNEGFARYAENLVRERLGLKKNTSGLLQPFERHLFYEIGSRYIELLFKADKTLSDDLVILFYRMMCKI